MSTLLHPVGPQPPAVYWFRRLLLLAAVLAVVVAVGMLTTGGRADGTPPAQSSATTTGDPTSDAGERAGADGERAAEQSDDEEAPSTRPSAAAATEAGVPSCAETGLAVSVTADSESYAATAVPRLTVSLRNEGTTACTVDVGSPDAVEVVVTSGDDRVWSSDDCQPDAEARVVTLQPSAEEVQSISWQRGRSAEGCPTGLPEVRAGTYQVTARAGDITSEPVAFTLQ